MALRAKQRFPTPANTFNSNGDGTYSFPAGSGSDDQKPHPAIWTIEFSMNSDVNCQTGCTWLNEYRWEYLQDVEKTYKTKFVYPFGFAKDIINTKCIDHFFGTNDTTTSDDVTVDCLSVDGFKDYKEVIGENTVAQNSWQPTFTLPITNWLTFNVEVAGIYDFILRAFPKGQIGSNDPIVESRIRVLVNSTAVPSFPTMTSDCAEANLDAYDGIFKTTAECEEFVNAQLCT